MATKRSRSRWQVNDFPSAVAAPGMRVCSGCGSRRFGLIRHSWGAHQFCRKECMERFKSRLNSEVWPRTFVSWLTGRTD
jgi:hypothetical protein